MTPKNPPRKSRKNKTLGYTTATTVELIRSPKLTLTCLPKLYAKTEGLSVRSRLNTVWKIAVLNGGSNKGTAIVTVSPIKILASTIAQSLEIALGGLLLAIISGVSSSNDK